LSSIFEGYYFYFFIFKFKPSGALTDFPTYFSAFSDLILFIRSSKVIAYPNLTWLRSLRKLDRTEFPYPL